MNTAESYRYAEFYNISIEECHTSCDVGGEQLRCGNVTTACGTSINCPATCSSGATCWEGECVTCPSLNMTQASPATKSDVPVDQWQCGDVPVVCTTKGGELVQTSHAVGIDAPSDAHVCDTSSHTWACSGKSAWSYFLEGKMCGSALNECMEQVQLWTCPLPRDQCVDHTCICDPFPVPPESICGSDSDGCGNTVTFGSLDGGCPASAPICTSTKTCCMPETEANFEGCGSFSDGCEGTVWRPCPVHTDVCYNHGCCSPLTASSFDASWQCGTAPDGCGGTVHFEREAGAAQINDGCGPNPAGNVFSCDASAHTCSTKCGDDSVGLRRTAGWSSWDARKWSCTGIRHMCKYNGVLGGTGGQTWKQVLQAWCPVSCNTCGRSFVQEQVAHEDADEKQATTLTEYEIERSQA